MRSPAIDPRTTVCPHCGRPVSSATKPDCPTTLPVRREVERARRMFGLEREGAR